MITYSTLIQVINDGQSVGMIHDDDTGVYYLPHGYTKSSTTKIYPSVAHCKLALEHED